MRKTGVAGLRSDGLDGASEKTQTIGGENMNRRFALAKSDKQKAR